MLAVPSGYRIEHVVMAEANVDLCLQHLLHPRHAAPFRVAVETPLQVNVHQRVGDEVDAGHFQQAEQPRGVSAVVRVHRRGVAGGDFRSHLQLQRQRRHGLDEARLLVVDFIAVHVHQPIVFLRQRERLMQRLHAVFAGEFEVRNGTHHVGPSRSASSSSASPLG